MTTPYRLLVVVLLVVLGLAAFPSTASASMRATSNRQTGYTTVRWSVAPVLRGATPTSGPLLLEWQVSQGTAYNYFDVVNNGTVTVGSHTLIATNTGTRLSTVILESCSVAWTVATHQCAGVLTTLGQSSTQITHVSTQTLTVGSRLHLRGRTNPNANSSLVTRIDVQVQRDAVRASTTVNR